MFILYLNSKYSKNFKFLNLYWKFSFEKTFKILISKKFYFSLHWVEARELKLKEPYLLKKQQFYFITWLDNHFKNLIT